MLSNRRTNRILTIALLAASALGAFAPVAQAGHAYGRRYKGVVYSAPATRVVYTRPYVVHEHSAAPVLAGLVGGIILGAAMSSHATPVVVNAGYSSGPHHGYRYYDPYCGEWFTSLTMAREHCGYERHPWQMQVYYERGGECVRTLRWSDGAWYDCGRSDDWDD